MEIVIVVKNICTSCSSVMKYRGLRTNFMFLTLVPAYIIRCRGAVVSPREQQIDTYIIWIKGIRSEMATRGYSDDPARIKNEIIEHEVWSLL